MSSGFPFWIHPFIYFSIHVDLPKSRVLIQSFDAVLRPSHSRRPFDSSSAIRCLDWFAYYLPPGTVRYQVHTPNERFRTFRIDVAGDVTNYFPLPPRGSVGLGRTGRLREKRTHALLGTERKTSNITHHTSTNIIPTIIPSPYSNLRVPTPKKNKPPEFHRQTWLP